MLSVSQTTRMAPNIRINRLLEFNRRLSHTPASTEVLREFNFELDHDLVHLDGRLLPNQKIKLKST